MTDGNDGRSVGGDDRPTYVNPSETITVLHVDDEPDFADMTAAFLRRWNERFEVMTATSAEDGLAIIDREAVDCIVSDYDMPDRTGVEFLRTVRDRHGDVPFVLFTGRGSEEVASEAISAGVNDYLRKESGTDQYAVLANRIESVVSRSWAERRLTDHLDRMTDAFYGLDENWRFTYLNERAERVLRRNREELIGRSVWEEFPETVGTELEAEYRETRETEEATVFEYHYPPLDVDFEVHAYPSDTGLSVYFRDVTEQRARRRELRELSERLELALEGGDVGVWDWNVKTDAVTFDDRWAAMLGYDVEELSPDLSTWEDRIHPDDADAVRAALEPHLSGEVDQYQCDHRLRTKDGSWKWIRDRGRVVERDADGEPVRAVGIHIDVTEEKERERDLERYRRIVDEMPESVAIYDADGRFRLVNEHLASVYDEPVESLVGRESPLLKQLRERRADDPFASIVDGDRARFSETNTIELLDGSEEVVDYDLTRLVIDGDFDGVLGIFRNVTESTRREERLERISARLKVLFEDSPDMIDVHDTDGRIVDVNRSLCDALGYDPEELIGMMVWEVDAEIEPETATKLWSDLQVDETVRLETTYRRRDDTTFPVEVHVRRIDLQGGDQFLVSSRDVSERRAYQRRIERENERLDEFASIVSHDLRNPLNVLSGYLGLARETGDPSHFERCERAVDDMERLIDDLLALAKQGKRVGDREDVSLGELVDRCWENVEHDGLTLRNAATRGVSADAGRLQQLLENLFRNAAEHGGSTVTVGDLHDGFYVEDDGPGIPADERESVFKSGYTTSTSGTGFGLSIVESIAEAHGWTVSLAEARSGGARFEFTGVERTEGDDGEELLTDPE